jgi:hypothetical protein
VVGCSDIACGMPQQASSTGIGSCSGLERYLNN